MGHIIACIDGADYTDSICDMSAWVAKNTDWPVSVLHVVSAHAQTVANDLSGSIGLGAKSDLLEQLVQADEDHGKAEQKKGQAMLNYATKRLSESNVAQIETMHRRGEFAEAVAELAGEANLVVLGKHGEKTQNIEELGENLEHIARSINTPLLIVAKKMRPIKRIMVAFDGNTASRKTIEYIADMALFSACECHILTIGEEGRSTEVLQKRIKQSLHRKGISVVTAVKKTGSVAEEVKQYSEEHHIDLLMMGAYGHSKLHNFILGSTTKALIHASEIPVLLFR